jgi:hypothetical protein
MVKPTWTCLLLSLLGLAPAHAAAMRLTPAQQQAIFPEQRQLVLSDQNDRLHTLEQAQRCVTAARNSEQLMGCLVTEHQQTLRTSEEHHAAMLSILRHHGVNVVAPATAGSTQP